MFEIVSYKFRMGRVSLTLRKTETREAFSFRPFSLLPDKENGHPVNKRAQVICVLDLKL